MHEEYVKERFPKDVESHEMEVIRDIGGYRHLRFKDPRRSAMYFDLITWPGHLCYTGDMGTYVFSRVTDMFEFFRDDKLRINPQYWEEKVLAKDRSGTQQWSPKKFQEMAERRVREYFEDEPETLSEALSELNEHVIEYAHEEWEAAQAYMQFQFAGFYPEAEELGCCYEHTFRFLWCCHALVWGIQQYDQRGQA